MFERNNSLDSLLVTFDNLPFELIAADKDNDVSFGQFRHGKIMLDLTIPLSGKSVFDVLGGRERVRCLDFEHCFGAVLFNDNAVDICDCERVFPALQNVRALLDGQAGATCEFSAASLSGVTGLRPVF